MDLQIDPRTTPSSNYTRQLPDPTSARSREQLRESAREMEAIYINDMYKAMRETVPDDGLFGRSSTTKTFEEMLDMELARKTAEGKGTGLGEAIYKQLSKDLK